VELAQYDRVYPSQMFPFAATVTVGHIFERDNSQYLALVTVIAGLQAQSTLANREPLLLLRKISLQSAVCLSVI
jgi:hypothetical protein